MLKYWEWPEHFLLVSFMAGRESFSFLLDHATQDQFFAEAVKYATTPSSITLVTLSEDAFLTLLPRFKNKYLIEGE